MQIALEDEFTAQAKASGRPCVVFFDRGLMDGKAYMTDAQWELLLDELHLTPVMMRDARYDAVLHMMTAADGAEKFYTNANNAVRLESAEEARAMDRRTLDCWTGHEHLYIVDNSSDFTEKIRRAVARVSRLVGVPVPLAVNRKFLLKKLPKTETLLQHVKRVEVFEVEQTYLATTTVAERCRIRRRQQGTNQSFQHQAWVAGADGSETLMERTLSGTRVLLVDEAGRPEHARRAQDADVLHVGALVLGAQRLPGRGRGQLHPRGRGRVRRLAPHAAAHVRGDPRGDERARLRLVPDRAAAREGHLGRQVDVRRDRGHYQEPGRLRRAQPARDAAR